MEAPGPFRIQEKQETYGGVGQNKSYSLSSVINREKEG